MSFFINGLGCNLGIIAATTLTVFSLPVTAAEKPVAPIFVDIGHYAPKPDLDTIREVKFLTELDAPPFSYIGPDGEITGFNIDITREICRILDRPCTIQGMRWELLSDGLKDKRGNAIIAQIAMTAQSRENFRFSKRYMGRPGRFMAPRSFDGDEATPEKLAGKIVAVVADTAHEAFLRTLFPGSLARTYPSNAAALAALGAGEADMVFADALSLSLWMSGKASSACCRFVGGPFTESRYFGEGLSIAVAHEDRILAQALDYAIARLGASGRFEEIYLKYFPVPFY